MSAPLSITRTSVLTWRMRDRPRRYPPTIYPPRSQALADYRDGWDTGYGIARAHGIANALLHALNDDDTPHSHGLVDGAVAWWRREQRAMAGEKAARARERVQANGPPH